MGRCLPAAQTRCSKKEILVIVSESVQAVRVPKAGNELIFHRVKIAVFVAVVVLLISAAYFSPHIWHHGEAREALVIQDIVHNHRWVLPLRNSELPSKPLLYHWIAASITLLIGLSDFTIRLPSVIGAAILVGATYTLGKLDIHRNTDLIAVGILGSTFEFWDSGTAARVDMLFAALIGVALTGWYLWYRSGREFARALAYSAVAFAVLAKGPAGVVLPVLVIVCFLIAGRDLKRLMAFFSWPWVLTVLVIDFGWYVAASERGGADFWYKLIIYENIERFFGAGAFHTQRNSYSQAVWLMTQLFPWSLVLVGVLIRWLRGRRQDSLGRFLNAWWMTIFGFFLFASGQRAVYLLPIYPAVALLAAREVLGWSDGKNAASRYRSVRFHWRVAAVIIIVAIDLSLAVAIPISRTVREDHNDQEEFIEEIIPKIPRTATLYAAPDFPETALIVLAYRLNRNIERQTLQCEGDYYYLTEASPPSTCMPKASPIVSRAHDHKLLLLHLSNSSSLTGRFKETSAQNTLLAT
jgi:4-amino-4-deoxy-L-arabinose transferase-like glycosyltransferase